MSLQLCSFFIDSVHVFNVLLLRVSVDVASSSGSRRGFILTRFQCRNYVRFFFFAAIPSLAHVLRVAGRGENVFCQGFSKEFCMFFVSGLAHVYVILSIAVESPCCCRGSRTRPICEQGSVTKLCKVFCSRQFWHIFMTHLSRVHIVGASSRGSRTKSICEKGSAMKFSAYFFHPLLV